MDWGAILKAISGGKEGAQAGGSMAMQGAQQGAAQSMSNPSGSGVSNLQSLQNSVGNMMKDTGFYGHMTHKSMQKNEESVKVSGDGFHDSSVPKTPKTDCFYHNVKNWKR